MSKGHDPVSSRKSLCWKLKGVCFLTATGFHPHQPGVKIPFVGI